MPFDGAGYPPKRQEPRRRSFSENALHVCLLVFALVLLVMPVSVAALVDLVRYLHGH